MNPNEKARALAEKIILREIGMDKCLQPRINRITELILAHDAEIMEQERKEQSRLINERDASKAQLVEALGLLAEHHKWHLDQGIQDATLNGLDMGAEYADSDFFERTHAILAKHQTNLDSKPVATGLEAANSDRSIDTGCAVSNADMRMADCTEGDIPKVSQSAKAGSIPAESTPLSANQSSGIRPDTDSQTMAGSTPAADTKPCCRFYVDGKLLCEDLPYRRLFKVGQEMIEKSRRYMVLDAHMEGDVQIVTLTPLGAVPSNSGAAAPDAEKGGV